MIRFFSTSTLKKEFKHLSFEILYRWPELETKLMILCRSRGRISFTAWLIVDKRNQRRLCWMVEVTGRMHPGTVR